MNNGDKIIYRASGNRAPMVAYIIRLSEEGFSALVSTSHPDVAPGTRHWLPTSSIVEVVAAAA